MLRVGAVHGAPQAGVGASWRAPRAESPKHPHPFHPRPCLLPQGPRWLLPRWFFISCPQLWLLLYCADTCHPIAAPSIQVTAFLVPLQQPWAVYQEQGFHRGLLDLTWASVARAKRLTCRSSKGSGRVINLHSWTGYFKGLENHLVLAGPTCLHGLLLSGVERPVSREWSAPCPSGRY